MDTMADLVDFVHGLKIDLAHAEHHRPAYQNQCCLCYK